MLATMITASNIFDKKQQYFKVVTLTPTTSNIFIT